MSPTSQYCRGPQLDTRPLKYGITAPVANNPRTPRIMENLVISSCSTLGHRGRWSRRSVFAVRLLDLRSHFLQSFALIHHLHHVTRDAYADASGKAHSIEYRVFLC